MISAPASADASREISEAAGKPAAFLFLDFSCSVRAANVEWRFSSISGYKNDMADRSAHRPESLLGIGFYTLPEAARLLKTPARNIRRWMGGYAYVANGETHEMPPLWRSQLPCDDGDKLELGFRDLIELRFVTAFIEKGLSLQAIRACLEHARECVKDERPFSTRRFRTDGRTIFLESLNRSGAEELLDLKTKQYAFKQVLERSFKDLDLEGETVARWRPFQGKASIVIDPLRSFGQPVASNYGVPTAALAAAVEAEGSMERVARLYEVPPSVVRDAVDFEKDLRRAA